MKSFNHERSEEAPDNFRQQIIQYCFKKAKNGFFYGSLDDALSLTDPSLRKMDVKEQRRILLSRITNLVHLGQENDKKRWEKRNEASGEIVKISCLLKVLKSITEINSTVRNVDSEEKKLPEVPWIFFVTKENPQFEEYCLISDTFYKYLSAKKGDTTRSVLFELYLLLEKVKNKKWDELNDAIKHRAKSVCVDIENKVLRNDEKIIRYAEVAIKHLPRYLRVTPKECLSEIKAYLYQPQVVVRLDFDNNLECSKSIPTICIDASNISKNNPGNNLVFKIGNLPNRAYKIIVRLLIAALILVLGIGGVVTAAWFVKTYVDDRQEYQPQPNNQLLERNENLLPESGNIEINHKNTNENTGASVGNDKEVNHSSDQLPSSPRIQDVSNFSPGTTQVFAGFEMVWIPAGTYETRISNNRSSSDHIENPPNESITISNGFWLGKYEVTQSEWKSVMGTEPWQGKDTVNSNASSPAVYIRWNDVQVFVNNLSSTSDFSFRLPSEEEWEYAYRAGTSSRFYWGNEWKNEESWNSFTSGGRAHSVGDGKKANAWGLYDMAGNVWEWCQDCYQEEELSIANSGEKSIESGCSFRIIRGGSWYSLEAGHFEASAHHMEVPEFLRPDLGFRLAMDNDSISRSTYTQMNTEDSNSSISPVVESRIIENKPSIRSDSVPIQEEKPSRKGITHTPSKLREKECVNGKMQDAFSFYVVAVAEPTSGKIPLLIRFTGVIQSGNPPFNYHWDFRDGETSNDLSPVHTFRKVGVFNVTLTVTDAEGNSVCDSIAVMGQENPK